MDILRACVNVEELFIKDGYSDILGSNDSITLSYLRKLHINCAHRVFLISLETPYIQDFAIVRRVGLNISTTLTSSTTLKRMARSCSNTLSPHVKVHLFVIEFHTSDHLWSSNSIITIVNVDRLNRWWCTGFLVLSWSTRKWTLPPYPFHDWKRWRSSAILMKSFGKFSWRW